MKKSEDFVKRKDVSFNIYNINIKVKEDNECKNHSNSKRYY